MNRIVEKQQFSEKVYKLVVEAPLIARARKAGHFVIVRVGEHGERMPLTIAEADRLEADVLSGGVSWSGDAVQCSDHLFWLKGFNGMQFTVVFRRFYDALLQDHPKVSFVTDIRLSELSDNIFVTYPYLSVQREFGYSDVTPCNNPRGHVDWLFRTTREKFRILNKVRSYYQAL